METPQPNEDRKISIRGLVRDWRFILVLIITTAILIRSLPMWIYAAWGSDLGIYYGLTKEFIASGQFYNTYGGWGASYNYFPVLYVVAGGLHTITGINPLTTLMIMGPLFGGLTVGIIYFIAHEIGLSRKVALTSAAILAVLPMHVYQTSHAAPLVMGHFFFLASLLFFIKSHKDRRFMGPLYICTFLLIASHHLSTYMYIITIMFVIFWQNMHSREWTEHLGEYVFYILATLTFAFSYWAMIATPVYYGFIDGATPFATWSIIVLCYALFALTFVTIHLKRRYFPDLFVRKNIDLPVKWEYDIVKFTLVFILAVVVGVLGEYAITKTLTLGFLLWTIPVALVIGFATTGWSYIKRGYIHGWFLVLSLSFIFAIITGSRVLFPERHMEYIAEPLAILAGIGIFTIMKELKSHKKAPFAAFLVALLVANTVSIASIYTSPAGGTDYTREGLTDSDLFALEWIENNVPNGSVVASDHTISMFVYNHTITNTEMDSLWTSETWQNCTVELNGTKDNATYGNVNYIIIDDIMFETGVKITATYVPLKMTNESYAKFWQQPFELIYRNCSYDVDNETIMDGIEALGTQNIDFMDFSNETMMEHVSHWTEIYQVNWTYIDSYIP